MNRIQRIVSTTPGTSHRRSGWLASTLLLGSLVGATSLTAYGVSIDEGAGVNPLAAVLPEALGVNSAVDSTDDLIRIKRAKLLQLAKEIAELEELRGDPAIVQTTQGTVGLVRLALTTRASRIVASAQEPIQGTLLDSDGKRIDGTLVLRPEEEARYRLEVRPTLSIAKTASQIVELQIEPETTLRLQVEPVELIVDASQEPTADCAAEGLFGLVVPAATTIQGQVIVEATPDVDDAMITRLRQLGYIDARVATATEAEPIDRRLSQLGYVTGQVALSTPPSGKTEIQRLADEVKILKKMIEDLNRKLDRKPRSD